MRLPWKKNKNAEKAAVQPRDERGKFAVPERETAIKAREASDQARQIETETKMFSGLAAGMKEIEEIVQTRQKTIEDAIEDALEDLPEPDGHSDPWSPLIKELLPYLPGIMSRFQISPSEIRGEGTVSPPSPPEQSPPSPQHDPMKYMTLAAQAHKVPGGMAALKAAMPSAFEEMEKAGVDPEVFKQAVQNINKVIK